MRYTNRILMCLVIIILASALLFNACQQQSVAPPATTVDNKLGLYTTKATGDLKFMVVLANFPDVKRKYEENLIRDRITGFVPNYFLEASNGKMSLKSEITKSYMLPHPVSYYKIAPANLDVDPARVTALVSDVIDTAAKDVKFTDDLYIAIALGATPAEYGMVGYCAVPGMLGWDATSLTTKSGIKINNAAVFCESAHLGTYIHDTLHMLGGRINNQRMTPCLYDHELQAKYSGPEDVSKVLVNMGYWDPLSSHFPYNKELPPTGLSSWTKLRLNWIDTAKIAVVKAGQTATVKLDPLADKNASTLVIKIPVTDKTYYLVENRQKVSSDVNCPTTGILVLYADDSVYECRQGKSPVKIMDANPGVPYMNDATFDIGKKDSYVDTKNNVAIVLEKKDGLSYQIQITTADKAKSSGK